ncbi:hypothetical protein, partial [Pseudorhodoplanes sp.]|uniref:hypothetical protein n=1 Tax=Pseudorhodoplanes sp. TaxID=1934341 RepID=UPI003D0A56BE
PPAWCKRRPVHEIHVDEENIFKMAPDEHLRLWPSFMNDGVFITFLQGFTASHRVPCRPAVELKNLVTSITCGA